MTACVGSSQSQSPGFGAYLFVNESSNVSKVNLSSQLGVDLLSKRSITNWLTSAAVYSLA